MRQHQQMEKISKQHSSWIWTEITDWQNI